MKTCSFCYAESTAIPRKRRTGSAGPARVCGGMGREGSDVGAQEAGGGNEEKMRFWK